MDAFPALLAIDQRLLRQNAFRLTGLTVDAAPHAIRRKLTELKGAAEHDDLAEELPRAYPLYPVPEFEIIRDAVQKLFDPELRLVDELFWFWPQRVGEGRKDEGLLLLAEGKVKEAEELWRCWAAEIDGSASAIGLHNLAVARLLNILDREIAWVKEDCATGSEWEGDIHREWSQSLEEWKDVWENEFFWSHVTERIRALHDARLPTGFTRLLRDMLPRILSNAIAHLGAAYADSLSTQSEAARIKALIDHRASSWLGDPAVAFQSVLSLHRSRIRLAVEKARAVVEEAPEKGADAAYALLAAAEAPLRTLVALMDPAHPDCRDYGDEIARAVHFCQVRFVRETNDWETSVKVLSRGNQFAVSQETRQFLAEEYDVVRSHLSLSPLELEIEESLASADHPYARVQKVRRKMLPDLERLFHDPAAYMVRADAIAGLLHSLAAESFETTDRLALPNYALELALQVAVTPSLREKLRRDQAEIGWRSIEGLMQTLGEQIEGSAEAPACQYARIASLVKKGLAAADSIERRQWVLHATSSLLRHVATAQRVPSPPV